MLSLKKRFPSLQSLGGDGNTSFLRAARAGNLERVLEHLKNNIDINTSNANGLNALHLASKDGHIHVVAELLKRGAIVDSATKKGNTALHIASLAGQEEVVQLLLQHNASVNVQSQNGFTPLYMAAQENHDSVVKLLLANGANQSLATEDGFTPLAVAMQQGHDKVVAVLLESDTRGKVRLPALHIAAKKDDVKAASLLLENDHNPDVTSKSGFTPLHIASHYGNQAIANLLIQKGADVNYSAKHNISPLHVAAKWGKTNMVSLLLEKGANIEAKTRDGLTPLHCAARSGHEQVVDMLLERGAPISAKTKNGLAPLHMAAQGEHVDAARILLYHRAPVDEVTVDYLTALHVAAHCGHVRVAKLLLDRNADANARALNGFTPLHIACKKNRIKVVELLLRHGASISATTESGLTPLHVAAFMGCMNIVIYLLQHDASPDVPTVRGETPLHLAARANQTDIIRILLRNGAQVDARAREQQTPLHIASRLGNVDIVMLLLQHGAQVDATTKDMYTALHIAAKEGQDEVAAVLIENGAALDSATKKGFTPLHLTAKYGHIKVAQLLLQKEADVDAQGKNGVTPLHVACHYDNQNVALLLLEKGASPHATAKNGHTPLHIAARKNQMDIATTLLEYGAQANAESKAGFTPLHLSSQEGHAEISNLLIEHKASVNHPAKNGLTPMHLCAQEDNVNVAEILDKNGANIDMVTKAGYTPLHVAAHFGQANMVRFLLQHGANVDAATAIGYTPLHQTAQQGHCHIVNLLLEHKANANAQTVNGQTPLHIARKLGYISVLDSLKTITNEEETSPVAQPDEKYRVVAPEAMHETFMSDSEEEGGDTNDMDPCYGIKGDRQMNDSHVYLPYYHGESLFITSEDNMLSDQPYRYLTVDEMKSLGDDSLPIDVTRDERVDSNRMTQSAEYGAGGVQQPITEEIISPHKAQVHGMGKSAVDGIYIGNGFQEEPHVGRKLSWRSFLVSFLVDARGGAMRGCRHSGVRIIIPSRATCQPTRVTCRYVKPQRTMHPPQLMEGEALASRVLELGPVSTKFIGPIIMEVPHFASLRGKEREIIILRSDNGETWREHTIDNSEDIIHDVMQQCFEPEEIAQLEEQCGNNVCRFVTYDFPQYFAVVSRIRQEVHAIGPEGGMVSSTVVPQVQAVFPQGALTKKIKVGLQAQPVDPDLTAKLLGRGVAVSPIVTVEPRRRKFHKAITLSMPAPKAHSQGMINQYSGNTPTLRLLCSITGGPSRAQWEDVTGSTPLTFVNDCVSFTTTVSARFWLMDCRNISEATKMATELYKEVIHVPFMARFVVFAKKVEPHEARLRVFCMTDDKEDKTLEKQELFTEVAKSRDVEVLEGKPQYIEMAGNLVPVTKSGEQLQLQFKAFRENRLPFTVRVKDQHADIVGRTLFMKEPKVAKGEPPQHPICILNIVLPEVVVPDGTHAFSDKITTSYRTSLYGPSKHQNDHYIGDIRIVDLSNLLGMDWIQLAPEIGISTEEIDEIINQNTDSIARQAQSMIRLFKDKPHYDIHALEDALKTIGREDIMQKCKSGRLSHSRDFDDTDIMKNSESVEELVREESKRIQQINEREEVKYSAEEKEVEESESDEEITKRTVAERREKIVKRLSVERQIPASTQKREIAKEITEIKRKSLIEDKKAIHESEIMMQLPTDNIIKSAIVPEQVIKMKMGKMDSVEVSKTDFDNELTKKFKTSGRSSEEEEESKEENLKEIQDVITSEKITKVVKQTEETSSISEETRKLTQDFLNVEKLSQLPVEITVSEKFVEEFREKSEHPATTTSSVIIEERETSKIGDKVKEYSDTITKQQIIEDIVSTDKESKIVTESKVTKIHEFIVDTEKAITEPKTIQKEDTLESEISIEKDLSDDEEVKTETSQVEEDLFKSTEYKTISNVLMDSAIIVEAVGIGKVAEPVLTLSKKPSEEAKKPAEDVKKPSEAAKKPSDVAKQPSEDETSTKTTTDKKTTVTTTTITTTTTVEKMPPVTVRQLTNDFIAMEQSTQLPIPAKKDVAEEPTVEPSLVQEVKTSKIVEKVVDSAKIIEPAPLIQEEPKLTSIEKMKLTHDFLSMEQTTQLPIQRQQIISDETAVKLIESPEKIVPKEEKLIEIAETVQPVKISQDEKKITRVDERKLTEDFLSFEQISQLPSQLVKTDDVSVEEQSEVFKKMSPKDHEQMPPSLDLDGIEKHSEIFEKMTLKEHKEMAPKDHEKRPLSQDFDEIEKQGELFKKMSPKEHEKIPPSLDLDGIEKHSEIFEKMTPKEHKEMTPKDHEKRPLSQDFDEIEKHGELFKKMSPKEHEKRPLSQDFGEIEKHGELFKKMSPKEHEKMPLLQDLVDIEKETHRDSLTKSLFDEGREIVDKVSDTIVVSTTEITTSVIDASSNEAKLPVKPLEDHKKDIKVTEHTVTFSADTQDKIDKISPKLQTFEVPLDEPSSYTMLERSMDGLDNICDTAQPLDMQKDIETRMITHDFLTMEQKTQIPVRHVVKTEIITKTVEEAPASREEQKLEDSKTIKVTTTTTTTTIEPIETRKLTADFLNMEQRTQLPVDKLSTGAFELTAPVLQEPRKSLTEVEFYKSIEETITRKMSEGLIDMNEAINQKGNADIPDSQTPPPTPIETQMSSAEPLRSPKEIKEKFTDTVTTLHTTTESIFERTSAISTIETLQDALIDSLQTKEKKETVRVVQPVQSQDIGNARDDDGDYDDDDVDDDDADDDDDDDEDDADRESMTSQPIETAVNVENITKIRNEATILVDKVLEESCHIVNEQQQHQLQHVNGHDAFDISKQQTHDYNTSDSDNYAITCDDVDGLDVIKSPTIESMSGKSFDDNLSFTEEHFNVHTNTSTSTTTTTTTNTIVTMQQQQVTTDLPVEVTKTIVTKTVVETQLKAPSPISLKDHDQRASDDASAVRVRRIERKFEKLSSNSKEIDEQAETFDRNFAEIMQDDEISNLQEEFSKLSWDDSVSPTTNTLADIGQTTPDNDIQDLTTETGEEFLKSTESTPVPVPVQATTTTATAKSTENIDIPTPKPRSGKPSSPAESELGSLIVTQAGDAKEEIVSAIIAPVPKPRAQLKQTESFKNLAALVDQGDNISLLSLDITDELSKTDEVSTDYSIKSQRFDQPISTTTYSEEPIDTFEPTSELSVDDADTEQSEVIDGKTTSFYIGESSRNVIIKTTPTRPEDGVVEAPPALGPIDAKDIALMQEHSVDSDEMTDKEGTDSFKEFTTMPREDIELESKITRQGSETRNDLLEHEADTQTIAAAVSVQDKGASQGISDILSNVVSSAVPADTASIVNVRPVELDLEPSLDKSELESLEKELSKASSKVVHSPQQPAVKISAQEVERTLDEVEQSLKAVNDELKHVVKDGKSIKESPSEFEFRDITSLHSTMETKDAAKKSKEDYSDEKDDISSFIGVPESVSQTIEERKPDAYDSTIKETLNKAALMAYYSQDQAPKEDAGSLGFISSGTADEYSSMEEHAAKEEHASLGFISTETAEDFSSMEDYYQEKLAKASVITEGNGVQSPSLDSTSGTFKEISSEQTLKPFDAVLHRVKTDTSGDSSNRWSVPEIDHSSSSDSYYRSFDKTDSRPLSSDIENLLTQANSSEYRTALDVSSVCRESTEYASAVSTFDSSSGKTISSHESMKSLDSETSANLGSIDVSELSETLVASTTDGDILDFEDIARLKDLHADDDEDSDESLEIAHQAFPMTEQQMQQSQMKRSQEMIFKPKGESTEADVKMETVKIEEYPKPKEVEKTWGLAYPIDAPSEETDKTDDILLYHGESRRSNDDVTKLASSLDEGSILSVSMSSTSNIDTVVENFEDLIGSASSSTGIDGFTLTQDDHLNFQVEDTFDLELESKEHSPQEVSGTTPPEEAKKRGHKRNESTAISGDALKDIADKELSLLGEGKESESESDTDPYESEYARQFRSPKDRKSKKKKQAAAEMDHSFETEKRPFTPSQLVAEVIVEDSITEELEAENLMIEERRPSQNMQDYSNIPDITVTEETQKSPSMEEEADKFPEKSLYKVKTQEELHKATDVPLHQQSQQEDESFQHRVQEQYLQKLAELKRTEVGAESDFDENKAPDSPDSFEMVDQPDISDEFVIIEEVAKEANEAELGGQSIKIKPTKYESKHDEEVEKMIIKSAPADPKLGSQLYRDDLNFEFEESPPTAGSGSGGEQQDEASDIATANKKWVEMQLTDAQLRYPYDLTGGILEDIKEEDGEFEVGSSRISSFKDSFSSTPEYDVLAGRRYFARYEQDDISMNSLQEFESLEQAISLENRNRTHQGSTDSSNGSFTRRYVVRHSGSGTAVGGDDISVSSLKEFEGLENACIEAHLIEIKAKEEAALLLSRSDESSRSNGSDAGNVVMTKITRTVTRTNEQILPGQNITEALKHKLAECGDLPGSTVKITEISSELMDKSKSNNLEKLDSDRGSVDSLEINKSLDAMTSSIESFEISKDATSKSEVESLDQGVQLKTRAESMDSMENEEPEEVRQITTVERQGESITTTTTTTTTSTDADGREHTVTSVITTTSNSSGGGILDLPMDEMTKDSSIDSLNMCIEQNTSSAGTTATYQTSAGNSQMSGSVTSCASSTLMEDSYPPSMAMTGNVSGGPRDDLDDFNLTEAESRQK